LWGFAMKPWKAFFISPILAFVLLSCSVVSPELVKEAEPPVPFEALLREVEKYRGKTVILGGYVLGIKHREKETLLCVLEVPLNAWHKPKSRTLAEGKFVVSHKGFLSVQRYGLDREITVAGKVLGIRANMVEGCPERCLQIESREIHGNPPQEYDYSPPYRDQAFDYQDTSFPRAW